jgi:hypothetical protein
MHKKWQKLNEQMSHLVPPSRVKVQTGDDAFCFWAVISNTADTREVHIGANSERELFRRVGRLISRGVWDE